MGIREKRTEVSTGPDEAPQAVFSSQRKKISKRAQDRRKCGVSKVRPYLQSAGSGSVGAVSQRGRTLVGGL